MNPWTALLVGILLGWLIEYAVDWFFWRRRSTDEQIIADLQQQLKASEERSAELETQLAALGTGTAAVVPSTASENAEEGEENQSQQDEPEEEAIDQAVDQGADIENKEPTDNITIDAEEHIIDDPSESQAIEDADDSESQADSQDDIETGDGANDEPAGANTDRDVEAVASDENISMEYEPIPEETATELEQSRESSFDDIQVPNQDNELSTADSDSPDESARISDEGGQES